MQLSSYELFRRLATGHTYIPNRKHLIPSRSLATSEAYTLYLGTAISILRQSLSTTIAGPAKGPDRNRKVKIQNREDYGAHNPGTVKPWESPGRAGGLP